MVACSGMPEPLEGVCAPGISQGKGWEGDGV